MPARTLCRKDSVIGIFTFQRAPWAQVGGGRWSRDLTPWEQVLRFWQEDGLPEGQCVWMSRGEPTATEKGRVSLVAQQNSRDSPESDRSWHLPSQVASAGLDPRRSDPRASTLLCLIHLPQAREVRSPLVRTRGRSPLLERGYAVFVFSVVSIRDQDGF